MCCWALLGAFGMLDGGLGGSIGRPCRDESVAQRSLGEPWEVLGVSLGAVGGAKGRPNQKIVFYNNR